MKPGAANCIGQFALRLYRLVRHPMYVSISILLIGWIISTASPLLLGYTVVLAIGFHLRVLLYEEPRLRRQFGAGWNAYSAAVPRWLPRVSLTKKKK